MSVSKKDLKVVDSMVAGGMSLEEIESHFRGEGNKSEGIVAAVQLRKTEAARVTHSKPQPSGATVKRLPRRELSQIVAAAADFAH